MDYIVHDGYVVLRNGFRLATRLNNYGLTKTITEKVCPTWCEGAYFLIDWKE